MRRIHENNTIHKSTNDSNVGTSGVKKHKETLLI